MSWPINNRSDSLQVDYHYLRRRVGSYFGYGHDHTQWDDEQNEIVNEAIDGGTRDAYNPPLLPQAYASLPRASVFGVHEWSFMRPIWQVTTVADQRRYSLPQNFERPIGTLSYQTEDNSYAPIKFVSSSRLRALEKRVEFTAPPEYAAIEPAESTGAAPQTLTLVLHPTPDADYPLALQYQAHARRLSEDSPYPLGGQPFGPVILAACLAHAELRKTGQQGPMQTEFYSKLASAINRDRKRGAHLLGYNGNAAADSFGRAEARMRDLINYSDVTYNNVLYEGQ